jgi:Ran GTPase-activating protein (RanGAP) involved in mRNA processing and transport
MSTDPFLVTFGAVRSLIAQPDKYSKWIGNILEELEDAYKLDPERYREEMLPYLRDHDAIWRAHAMSTGLDNARLRPLLEYAPFLRFRTELYDFEDLGRLDMFDAIDRIVSVTMGDFRDDPYVDWEWFGSLPWKELGRLDLINFGVEPRGVRKMFSSGRLSTLEDLCLSGNRLGLEGAEALVDGGLTALRELALNTCQLDDASLEALARGESFSSLQKIDFGSNSIGDEGIAALAASSHFPNLQELDLGWNRIGVDGARALASATFAPNLKKLSLSSNNITDEGVVALAESELLENLEHLDLKYTGVNDRGALAISNSIFAPKLTSLSLSRTIAETTRQTMRDAGRIPARTLRLAFF